MEDILVKAFIVGLLIRAAIKVSVIFLLARAIWPGEITALQVALILLVAGVLDVILGLFGKKPADGG